METFGGNFAKRLQKHQKSIGFFTKTRCRFMTLQNIKKTLVKQRFGAGMKVVQNTL